MNAKRNLIMLIMLGTAALACNTPGADVATSTLPTAATAETGASPQVTASTATTVRPTLVATPTQFTPPTTAAPISAECPAPGSATLPNTPPTFADYADTIEAYLSGGGSIEELQQTLGTWGGITNEAGGVVATEDLTGDDVPEVVMTVQAPVAQFPDFSFPPGDLYIYGCAGGAYETLYGDYSTPDRPTPDLVSVEDINEDGRSDVVYTTHYCGAHTCGYNVHALSWQPATSVFAELMPEVTGVPNATIGVANEDGGTTEIIVDVGAIGSAGAGPQRLARDTYVWNGSMYELGSHEITTPMENWFPIHYIMDADDAMDRGELEIAILKYQQMIDLPDPKTLMVGADEIPALEAYARYRIMVAQVMLGDMTAAQATHDALFAEYDAAPDKPGAGFAAMANTFWIQYAATPNVKSACGAVIAYGQAQPQAFEILNMFGYANKYYEAVDLCPFE